MSQPETLLLGFIAGVTIFLGLPLGRLRNPRPELRQFLNALAIGILIFLLWDVLTIAWEPINAALGDIYNGDGGFGSAFGYGALFVGATAVGLMSLVYYERWLEARSARSTGLPPPAIGDVGAAAETRPIPWSAAKRLALLIAVGIGLHNFGEGLAIGGSAASEKISLATVLVIGFALHNATEGFGIVAPLAAEAERPSWQFLFAMGVIGGGPTFLGTLIGRQFTSDAMMVIFLTLAAGSIIYVVVQLLGVAHRAQRKELLYWGLLAGVMAGFMTDAVVIAGGA